MTKSPLSLAIKKIRFEFTTKSHLENLLKIVDNKLVSGGDSNWLKREIRNIDKGNIRDIYETRKIAKRIIQRAKFFRDNGKYGYLIEDKFYDLESIQKLAGEILKSGKGSLRGYSNQFLYEIVTKDPSKSLSINQVDYFAALKKRFDTIISPYLNNEKFDLSVYSNNDSTYINAKRLLKFATNGRMNGGIEGDYLEKIKDKWYNPNTGLNSLRKNLRDYIYDKDLKVEEDEYEFIIQDLEKFYSKKENRANSYN